MGLTAEQQQMRLRLIGASETASLAGCNPYGDAVSVWSTKARGPDGEVAPLVAPSDGGGESEAMTMGNYLEPTIVDLYLKRFAEPGTVALPCHTLVHDQHDFIGATPDRLIFDSLKAANDNQPKRGLECKLVGPWMVSDWDEGVPDYVIIQAQQNMAVTKLDEWDVAALLAGTEFRCQRVYRDDHVIAALIDIAKAFWNDCVVADVMPEITDGREAMKVLARQWAKDNGKKIEAPAEAGPVAQQLIAIQAAIKEGKRDADILKSQLCQMVGENKGMVADWGSFSFATMKGGVQWKSVAEALADVVADYSEDTAEEILNHYSEQHRADSYRKAMLYPKKAKR